MTQGVYLQRSIHQLEHCMKTKIIVGESSSPWWDLSPSSPPSDRGSGPKLCVAFVGMGSQHPAMGRQLAERYPPFLASIEENDRILVEVYGQPSLLERTGLFIPGAECSLNASGTWSLNDVILSFVYVQISLWDLIRNLGFKAHFAIGTRYLITSIRMLNANGRSA